MRSRSSSPRWTSSSAASSPRDAEAGRDGRPPLPFVTDPEDPRVPTSDPLPDPLDRARASRPSLGIQGPVVAFHDPWAGDASDAVMRTGTGIPIASQDPA